MEASKTQWLVAIIAIGLVLRLALLGGAFFQGDATLLYEGDTGTYQALAYAMAEGDFLFSEGHAKEMAYIRTWGYPLFMALGYAAGLDDFAISFLQVLLEGVAIFLVFRLGERWGVGVPAAALYAVSPLFISFSFKLVSESFFVFVFLFANFLFFRGMDSTDRRYLLFAGLVFGFLILVRPIALAFPVFYAAVYYWKKREWRGAAYLVLAAYAIAGLWVLRNAVVLNELSFSRIGTISYACWTGPLLANDARVDTTRWGDVREKFGFGQPANCTVKPYATIERAAEVTTEMAARYPVVYLDHMGRAGILLFAPQTPGYVMDVLGQERPELSLLLFEHGLDIGRLWEAVTRNGLYFGLLALFTAYQLVLYGLFAWGMWKSKEGRMLLMLAVVMAGYIVVVQGPQILFSGYRYRLPLEPLIVLGAAMGLDDLLQRRKNG